MSTVKPSRWLALLALGLVALPAAAQVPAANQATLVLRILAFDRKLAARAQGTVKIAVLYKEGDAGSEASMSEIAGALDSAAGKNTVSGLAVKTVRIGYSTAAKLEADLQRAGASAAYLCPGLDDAVPAIAKATQARSVLSFTGTEGYVRAGASVGLVRREAKAAVLVHLGNARAEGADLDSGLLRIAEVIR